MHATPSASRGLILTDLTAGAQSLDDQTASVLTDEAPGVAAHSLPVTADIQRVVAEIQQLHEAAGGGSTYSLHDGSLAGAGAFAVAIYPDRSRPASWHPTIPEL